MFLKNAAVFIWEVVKIIIITLVIVLPIRYFVFQPFFVRGASMFPSFHNNDYLIVDEISYRFRAPKRGEVIVFKDPYNPSLRFIKRIIGLPGEKVVIQDGKVMIYSLAQARQGRVLDESSYLSPDVQTLQKGISTIVLGKNEYFVLGDNRMNSTDSRVFGAIPRESIIGRVFVRAWPVTALAKMEAPSY